MKRVYNIQENKLLSKKDSEIMILREENEILNKALYDFVANANLNVDGVVHTPPHNEFIILQVCEYCKIKARKELENEI